LQHLLLMMMMMLHVHHAANRDPNRLHAANRLVRTMPTMPCHRHPSCQHTSDDDDDDDVASSRVTTAVGKVLPVN
jgi:hypothetical protein